MPHIVIAVETAGIEASDKGAFYTSLAEAERAALIAATEILSDELRYGYDLPGLEVSLRASDGQRLKRLTLTIASSSS
jgi:hypothetical protein